MPIARRLVALRLILLLPFLAVDRIGAGLLSAQAPRDVALSSDQLPLLFSDAEAEAAMASPGCLEGFQPTDRGRVPGDYPAGMSTDGSFSVEIREFQSEGFRIHGWLFLPREAENVPLVVLTNGGGSDERVMKSLSNFMAPRLAYCGVAAFVNDKRGTGESGGVFRDTDYEDYIADTGNAARFLASDPRIDSARMGVMGGSEGGRIAVVAAARYPIFSFVVSLMGSITNPAEDRFLADKHAAIARGLGGAAWEDVERIWRGAMDARATGDPADAEAFDQEILSARERFPRQALPFTWRESQSGGIHDQFRPTYESLRYDYSTEMESFRKPWLAIYGEVDTTVFPEPSIREIHRTTTLSGNTDVSILVLPRTGHSPVDVDTHRRVLFENPILNWMEERGLLGGSS